MTNFDSEKRKFTKKLDEKKSLVRWYFVKEGKLVYRKDKDLYSVKLEEEKKTKPIYELIDFYLFDDNQENDEKVVELIKDVINSESSSKIDVLYAKLYLGEFNLMNGNFEEAEKSLIELKGYFNRHKDNGITNQYSLIIEMAETELELMRRIKN